MPFQTYCIVASPERIASGECLHLIPEKRQRRGQNTCSSACKKYYRSEYLKEWNLRHCKACGRPKGKAKARQNVIDREQGNTVPEVLHEMFLS